MESSFDSSRVDRRTLLVGSASLATGGLFIATGEAKAGSGEDVWTAAHVAAQISAKEVTVTPLDTNRRISVELPPRIPIHADLSTGNAVMIEGLKRADSSIAAERVVRLVFGKRSDGER